MHKALTIGLTFLNEIDNKYTFRVNYYSFYQLHTMSFYPHFILKQINIYMDYYRSNALVKPKNKTSYFNTSSFHLAIVETVDITPCSMLLSPRCNASLPQIYIFHYNTRSPDNTKKRVFDNMGRNTSFFGQQLIKIS